MFLKIFLFPTCSVFPTVCPLCPASIHTRSEQISSNRHPRQPFRRATMTISIASCRVKARIAKRCNGKPRLPGNVASTLAALLYTNHTYTRECLMFYWDWMGTQWDAGNQTWLGNLPSQWSFEWMDFPLPRLITRGIARENLIDLVGSEAIVVSEGARGGKVNGGSIRFCRTN